MLRCTRNCCDAPYSTQPGLNRVAVPSGVARSKYIAIFFSKTENCANLVRMDNTFHLWAKVRISPSLTQGGDQRNFMPQGFAQHLEKAGFGPENASKSRGFLWRSLTNRVRDERIRASKKARPSARERGGAWPMSAFVRVRRPAPTARSRAASGRFTEPARAR